ncbi:hypothetical protein KDM41_13690 [bacterium]|nr:hypothetical protein [bacterium]
MVRSGHRFIAVVALIALLAVLPRGAAAQTGFCDPADVSTATLAATGPGPYSLMVTPGGTGDAFTAARDQSGNPVDVTITYTLRDCAFVPVADFPAEDMWLEADDGGLVVCVGGSIADADTDAGGTTSWTRPLRAGGSSTAGCRVMVNGAPGMWGTFPLWFNSPDLNSDGTVNLIDVPVFATDFFGGVYRYRSDFHCDGVINLVDLVRFAGGLGAACP